MIGTVLGIIGLVLALVGGLLFYFGQKSARKAALIEGVPTSPAADVPNQAPGTLVEVVGTLRCDAPLTGELSSQACAYVSTTVEREYEVLERDSNGSTRRDKRSETVNSTTHSVPFSVEDESGRVAVTPDGADVDLMNVVDRYEEARSGASISIGGFNINLGSGDGTLGYRYRENILPVDQHVYVLGVVQADGSIGKPIDKRPNQTFTISYRSEEALLQSTASSAKWLRYSALALFVVGVLVAGAGIFVGR